jgi:tetratricopeptide (TPR) repeat protein
MLGQLYLSQRKLDAALKEFDAVAARQEKPVVALTMGAMILQAQGNLAPARERLEKALSIEPKAVIAANNLAWIYADAGENLDAALNLAQTATQTLPDTPELMDTLGWVYYKKKLPQLAIPLFARSAEKAPENAGYHYHLGLAYLEAGDPQRGRVSLQRALARNPEASTAAEIRRLLAAPSTAGTQE